MRSACHACAEQEGTDSKLHEVFMRLTNAALDAMDQAGGGEEVKEEREGRRGDASEIRMVKHVCLSSKEDGSGSYPVREEFASSSPRLLASRHPQLWSLLNNITWPALLSVLLVSLSDSQEASEPWYSDCAKLLLEQEPSLLPLDLKVSYGQDVSSCT